MVVVIIQAPDEAACSAVYDAAVKGGGAFEFGGAKVAEAVRVDSYDGGDDSLRLLLVQADREPEASGWVVRESGSGKDRAKAIAAMRGSRLAEASLALRPVELQRLKVEEPADYPALGRVSEAIVGVSGGR
jgi:hypothetical protein